MSKIILYIATSLDGFIADSDGGVDWLPQPKNAEELEEVGYNQLMDRIDTIVMGSQSYHQILSFGEWAWPDKKTYVFTSKSSSSELTCIEFTNDTPKLWIEKIRKKKNNKDIWLLGGAELVHSFSRVNLIDELILTIVPFNIGRGISFKLALDDFTYISEKSCMDGILQRVYLRKGQ